MDPNSANSSIPIHEQAITVNPQNDCPFFNGRLPPEIRDEIFSYALTETSLPVELDPASVYPKDVARPGYTTRRPLPIALLQTCRRIYLETYHLPVINKEHVFWHSPDRGPYSQHFFDAYNFAHEEWYFGLMSPWQLKLVKEIHLFTQMFWLEGSLQNLCDAEFMANIERVKITITRRDWWWNESNTPLYINPKTNPAYETNSPEQMRATIKREKRAKQKGRKLEPFPDGSWGSVFKKLPFLKELIIEFETSDDKKSELETIIEWAKTWKFPMNDGLVLSADDSVVKTSSWVGPRSFWTDQCPYCSAYSTFCHGLGTKDARPECLERRDRMTSDQGPTLHVMNLCWKLVKDLEVEQVEAR